jgi:RimJ/RimL family protein N-acetyltransferase
VPYAIETNDLVLRDFRESDVADFVRWETVETEWQLWDGPWDYEGRSEAERADDLERYVARMNGWVAAAPTLADDVTRSHLQIDTRAGRHIGWVGSYHVDGDYSIVEGPGTTAVGICVPELVERGHGYSYQALAAFVGYLMGLGERDVLTQTWSGNVRMVHVAERMGFVECCRKQGFRLVRGRRYDGLTFRLDPDRFAAFCRSRGLTDMARCRGPQGPSRV